MISKKTATALLIAGMVFAVQDAGAADKSVTPATKPSGQAGAAEGTSSPYDKVHEVFTGNTTVAGEPLVFPRNNPGVRSLVITMEPGEKTAWHQHGTPLYAYILQGELTVTYEGQGERLYTEGTGLLEAMHVTHQGHNTGAGPVRILAVFLTGDDGRPTVPEQAPADAQ